MILTVAVSEKEAKIEELKKKRKWSKYQLL